ncbi:MAG: carboxypeptidase-like regulatory domain-containing protein [Terriglobales bacterium]
MIALAGLIFVAAAAARQSRTQAPPNLGRSVHGVVLDARNQPLAAAIVYLKDARTKAIRTVITDDQGAYSFHQLQPNTSYDLYAVWKGTRSPSRTDSEFESAKDLRLDLKVPIA